MVYVDELRAYPEESIKAGARHCGRLWCHLWADTEDELHAFARRLGMKREWFQGQYRRAAFYHYDLTPAKRDKAIALGAAFMSLRDHGRQIATVITSEEGNR